VQHVAYIVSIGYDAYVAYDDYDAYIACFEFVYVGAEKRDCDCYYLKKRDFKNETQTRLQR
jgi:hypothetical protein